MSQVGHVSQIRLGKKQKTAIKNFFIKLEKYRVQTSEDEICIRLYNQGGNITLFEEQAKKYQYYAYQIVKRLTNRGIFTVKTVANPKTNKNVKVICISRNQLQDLQFSLNNEIKSRF